MGFNSAFKGLKLFKKPGNGRLNNLNDPVLNVLKPQHGSNAKFKPIFGFQFYMVHQQITGGMRNFEGREITNVPPKFYLKHFVYGNNCKHYTDAKP